MNIKSIKATTATLFLVITILSCNSLSTTPNEVKLIATTAISTQTIIQPTITKILPTFTETVPEGPNPENWIAFLNENNIWLIHPDGSNLTQITQNGSDYPHVMEFKWSPDGNILAYSISTSSGNAAIQLYDIQTSTTKTLVTDDVGGGFDWSLTGSQIIYDTTPKPSDPWSDKGLWVINLENGKKRQVVPPSKNDSSFMNPQWSSEGSQILYAIPAFEPAGYGVANFSTGKTIHLPLNPHGGSGAGNCEWSPDEILIACITESDEQPYKAELRFLDENGNIMYIVSLPEKMKGNSLLSWSPDAEKLAVSYFEDLKPSTDVYFIITGEFQSIGPGYVLDWSPDNKWLLTWIIGIDGKFTISTTNIASGESNILITGDGYQAMWQP